MFSLLCPQNMTQTILTLLHMIFNKLQMSLFIVGLSWEQTVDGCWVLLKP